MPGKKAAIKNRSKFIWSALSKHYLADLLLVNSYKALDLKAHLGCQRMFSLTSELVRWGGAPSSIYHFSSKSLQTFEKILHERQYDILFFRSAAMGYLAMHALKTVPYAKIIIDTDMLFSRLAELSWQANPVLSNRFYYLESRKLGQYENQFYNQSFLYFLCNPVEKEMVVQNRVKEKSQGVFKVLPNFLQLPKILPVNPQEKKTDKFILFFGTLNSAANEDAFKILVQDIYPKIQKNP